MDIVDIVDINANVNNKKKNPAQTIESIHSGHRQRMKEHAVSDGIDGMDEHNILELLLFYAIPRIDTNVIAHRLINTFGSLSEVFDAPYEELLKIDGISANSACLIKLIPGLSRAYNIGKHPDIRVFDTPQKIGEYFVDRFIGATSEVVYLMLLDSSLQLINCEVISEGSVVATSINLRMIIDKVVRHNACAVALAHNHPRGLALPSQEDLAVTSRIRLALKTLDIRFVEHVIVARNDYVPLIGGGYVQIDID